MQHVELVLLFLLVAVAALTWLARRLDVPYPILLVLGGSAIGFAPGVPDVQLQPGLSTRRRWARRCRANAASGRPPAAGLCNRGA